MSFEMKILELLAKHETVSGTALVEFFNDLNAAMLSPVTIHRDEIIELLDDLIPDLLAIDALHLSAAINAEIGRERTRRSIEKSKSVEMAFTVMEYALKILPGMMADNESTIAMVRAVREETNCSITMGKRVVDMVCDS